MSKVGDVCKICGGIEGGSPTGGEIDPATGLCITCQPCPTCGEMGGDCEDNYCVNIGRPRCIVHHRFEPCPTCQSYIAAGL